MENTKFIVTGSHGYIGTALCNHLGPSVTRIDKEARPKENTFRTDLRGDVDGLTKVLEFGVGKGADTVIHLAAKAQIDEENPLSFYDHNVVGIVNLLKAMKVVGLSKLIYASSAAVYGSTNAGGANEFDQLNPISTYGKTKKICEECVDDACNSYGLTAIGLRFFNVCGVHNPYREAHMNVQHIMPQIALAWQQDSWLRMLADERSVRDYVYIGDALAAILAASRKIDSNRIEMHQIYNICSGVGTSLHDLVALSKAYMWIVRNKDADLKLTSVDPRPGDPHMCLGSNTFARQELGWYPQRTVGHALNTVMDYILGPNDRNADASES